MATQLDGQITINGSLSVNGTLTGQIGRDGLLVEQNLVIPVPLHAFRVWDSMAALPTSGSSDDLGFVAGTFGTSVPYLATAIASGPADGYARALIQLPYQYVAAQGVYVRIYHGMITAVASSSATVDVEAYKVAKTSSLVSGSDLCTTAAVSNTTMTFATSTFTLTSTGLSPSDVLDLRVRATANGGSGYNVISGVEIVLSARG